MSVEIEVGLENAARYRPATSEPRRRSPPPSSGISPKVRRRFIIGIIAVLAVSLGLYLYFHNRETTDDAQVDGHITPIASKISGRIPRFSSKTIKP